MAATPTPRGRILMKVGLAITPYYRCWTTSFELGTLKSCLSQFQIDANVFNWHFEFAKWIGFENYFRHSLHTDLFDSYWTFARDLNQSNSWEFLKKAQMNPIELVKTRIEADRFCKKISQYDWDKYTILILDTFGNQLVPSLSIAKSIKERYPNLIIGLSGTSVGHPVMGPEYLKLSWIDIVFLGELEYAAVSLIRELESVKLNDIDLTQIPGIAYRRKGDICVQNDLHNVQLDDIPTPDYSDYLSLIQSHLNDPLFANNTEEQFYLGIEFSRGCTYGNKKLCKFCSYTEEAGLKTNERHPKEALKLLEEIHQKCPEINKFMIYDPLCPRKLLVNILQEWSKIRRHYQDSVLFFQTKPWHLKEDLGIMQKAGAKGIFLGIENLHPDVLAEFEKGQNICQSIANLKWSKEFGLYAEWWYLLSIPGLDNEQELNDESLSLIPKLFHLPPPYFIKFLDIIRGSIYFNQKYELGLQDVRPYLKYQYVLPDCIDIENAAYHWVHRDWCKKDKYIDIFKAIKDWRDRFQRGASLVLSGNCILDTRRIEKVTEISKETRKLLEFCDAPKSSKYVLNKFSDDVLTECCQNDWVVCLSGQYVSIVEQNKNDDYSMYLNRIQNKRAEFGSSTEFGEVPNSRWR